MCSGSVHWSIDLRLGCVLWVCGKQVDPFLQPALVLQFTLIKLGERKFFKFRLAHSSSALTVKVESYAFQMCLFALFHHLCLHLPQNPLKTSV